MLFDECKHNWIILIKTYAKSLHEILNESNLKLQQKPSLMDDNDVQQWHGVTTVLWECSNCKKTKKEELLGKEIKDEKISKN